MRVNDLPVSDSTSSSALISATDRLFYADSIGNYFYSCANPADATATWSELEAPGYPWSGTDNYSHGTIVYAYAAGKVYAFTTGYTSNDQQYSVICNIYDIEDGAWSGWNAIANLGIAGAALHGAAACNGSVYCLAEGSSTYLLSCKAGETAFTQAKVNRDQIPILPYDINAVGDVLYGMDITRYDDGLYGAALAKLDIAEKAFSYVDTIPDYGQHDVYAAVSVMEKIQTATGNGIVVAGQSTTGLGDMQLVGSDASITMLGSYGLSSASGYTVGSMAMFGGKLYLNCIDHTAGSDTTGLYTLPEEYAAELDTTDVIASAFAETGGTATVQDWRGEASQSVTMREGDIATWTASAGKDHVFAGWYDEAGEKVSNDATYSAPVIDSTELIARFTTTHVVRLFGDSALDTMNDIVRTGFTGTGGTVVLATLDNFPDALTAAGIAGLADAPVLLTSGTELSAQTQKLLASLRPAKIIVCGGPAAISTSVAAAAKKAAGAARLYRCAGSSRSGTACEVYRNAESYTGMTFGTTAFIATGMSFADALAIAPYAYSQHCPVFFSEDAASVSDQTIQTMQDGGIVNFYVLGGTAAVSDDVVSQLEQAGFAYKGRLSGDSRYETCEAIATFEISNGMEMSGVAIATGQNYKDALTGAAFCGSRNYVLLLADDDDRTAIDSFVKKNLPLVGSAYIFGGTAAVSQDTEDHLAGMLR